MRSPPQSPAPECLDGSDTVSTILVVDDTEANRYTLRRYLERAGFQVWEASSGQAGWETALRNPDLVLLDVKLPDANGYELCQRLKQDPRTALLPVLLISSALKTGRDKAHGLETGADGYLAAPVDQDELLAHVRLLLRLRRQDDELRRRERLLRDQAHSLEQEVKKRTAQLTQSNEWLRVEIAERKIAEASRGALLRQLITAQEDERRRIARELHDQMGQHITALSLGLKALKSAAPHCEPVARLAAELEEMTRQMGKEVHRLALELRPTALDDLGLLATLRNYLRAWSARTGVEADFQSINYPADGAPPEVETTFYRTVQEALNNVAKHARASRVSVVLECNADQVQVIIEDNGCGFEPEQVLDPSRLSEHLGLRGLKERLSLIGGSLEIESGPGKGTELFARVRLDQPS